jgi:hypothetical protein
MTGLRTMWGLNIAEGLAKFGVNQMKYLQKQLGANIEANQIINENGCLILQPEALCSAVASKGETPKFYVGHLES